MCKITHRAEPHPMTLAELERELREARAMGLTDQSYVAIDVGLTKTEEYADDRGGCLNMPALAEVVVLRSRAGAFSDRLLLVPLRR